MSVAESESVVWSRRRWTVVIFSVFAIHLGALLLFSSREGNPQRQSGSRASAHWLTEPAGARKALDLLLVTDPTQFAMVHSRGFSGTAWLRTQSPEYRPSEWTEEPRTLAQPTQLLGGAFRQAAATSAQPLFDAARKPAVAPPALAVTQPPLRTQSRLLVEGPARLRPLVSPPTLKSWPHTDVLSDTHVQVQVTADGLVFSPRLAGVASSKDPVQREADQHAVELARQLRFAPAPKNNRVAVEGVLIFQWHTTEPPASPRP